MSIINKWIKKYSSLVEAHRCSLLDLLCDKTLPKNIIFAFLIEKPI